MLAVDLPGHGLSDDPWEPDQADAVVGVVIAYALSLADRPLFAVSMGGMATVVGAIPLGAHVTISPLPPPGWTCEEGRAPCLIFVGGGNATAAAAANRYYRGRSGYGVVSSFGVTANGAALLQSAWAGHLREQMVAFLRDYLASACT